ncbi:MAG: hypothetical protein ACAH59_02045, partial [Pseudobdellovibrionaceae bacterium]
MIQKPHSICQSQMEVFTEAQAGQIFPRKTQTSQRPAIFPRLVENCKIGNSPGACYELFTLLRKLLRDLNASPQECLVPFGEAVEVKQAIWQGTQLMIQLAWGEKPPETGLARLGWFEPPDLALFCQLKAMFLRLYGEEIWEEFRMSMSAKLPGEAQVIESGNCLNCESLKKASEVFSPEEIWV